MLFDCGTKLADLCQLLLRVPCTTTSYICLHLHATGMLFLAFNCALCLLHHLVFLCIIFSVSAFTSLALYNLNVTVLSYPMLPDIHKNAPLSAGLQALPICPDMSSIKKMMSMKQWWNDIDREKWTNGRKTSNSTTLSTTSLTWAALGLKPGLLR